MSQGPRAVDIVGVGMTAFGKHVDRSLGSLTGEAVELALADGRIDHADVGLVVFSNAAEGVLTGQEMIRGEVALKDTDLAGLPLLNTENACASGSSAAYIAWMSVTSGVADVAIAVGAEKLHHRDKTRSFAAIESGTDRSLTYESADTPGGSVMMGVYGEEAQAYGKAHGHIEEALAAIAVKNREFATLNPKAQFREPIVASDVHNSRLVADPLRLLTCSPLTDGAAAVVFRARKSADARSHPRNVRFEACEASTNGPGGPVVKRAVDKIYARFGITADDIDVFQLHDACAFAELQQYEHVGITGAGEAIGASLAGLTGPRGPKPVNTDGGLLSRGHALGATGLAQLTELVHQLRGEAGARQVAHARRALAVNGGGWMGTDYATALATLLTV